MKRKANSLEAFFAVYKNILLFCLILLCAGAFRLTNLGLIEFKYDEALNLFLATRPLFGHPFVPTSLTSSIGIPNFPLVNYLLFPLISISIYPPFVSFCIAFINTFSIGWFFLILKKYFNILCAFITCLLFSFAPWPIFYSRKIWEQDFIVPLTICLLFAFFKIYIEKSKAYYALYIFVGLLLIQIHQIAGIVPVVLFPLLLKKIRPSLKSMILGTVLGILPMIPYIIYQIQITCSDCSLLSVASSHFFTFHPELFLRPFEIISLGNLHNVFGATDYLAFSQTYKIVFLFMKSYYLIYILLPISIVYFWYTNRMLRFFPIVSILIILLFFLLRISPEIHYFIVLLPFLFLFLGYFLSSLLNKSSKIPFFLGIILTATLIGSTIAFDTAFFHMLSQKGKFAGDYGTAFSTIEAKTQRDLSYFQNSSDYKEIFVNYYVPKEYIEGTTPIGKLLFPYDQLKKQIPDFIKQILASKSNLPDPRIVNAVFAYYTYPQNASPQTFLQLRNLALKSEVFGEIYHASYSNYLAKVLKRSYSNSVFLFEYPSHWFMNENEKTVSVNDTIVLFTVSTLPSHQNGSLCTSHLTSLAGITTIQNDCMNEKKEWTESFFDGIQMNSVTYFVDMKPLVSPLRPSTIQDEQKTLQEVAHSLIFLPTVSANL